MDLDIKGDSEEATIFWTTAKQDTYQVLAFVELKFGWI